MTQFLIPECIVGDDWVAAAFADIEKLFDTANIKFPLSNLLLEKESGTMIVELALAGYEIDDISITTEDSTIILEGKAKKKNDAYEVVYQDIKQSAFKQRIPVSSKFDLSQIDPEFKNGILTIKVPIAEDRKPKQIKIR